MNWLLYGVHALVLPWLLLGAIRQGKARLGNRLGPPILQPFWDACKFIRKIETVSTTASWAFYAAPALNVAVAVAAALMVPWLGIAPPIGGDLFLLVYLLALGKFFVSLSALDTGSAFGALGASREAAISIQSEPAFVLALAALALHAKSSSLLMLFAPMHRAGPDTVLVVLVVVAVWLGTMADLARMPFDDPTTHLELTMIHEAMVLENSGPNLALMEYAAMLKMTVLLGLVGQLPLMLLPATSPVLRYGLSLAALGSGALVVVAAESTLVKLRWRRIPNLLSYALLAATLACFLAVVSP
ncbi:MAG TPA: NADH-quinone oxidoreductase subunit H [Candidatus Xenobia bacterium]